MKQAEIKKWINKGIVSKSKSIDVLQEVDNPTINHLRFKAQGYKQALEDILDLINNNPVMFKISIECHLNES
jgi:hypothetical protein